MNSKCEIVRKISVQNSHGRTRQNEFKDMKHFRNNVGTYRSYSEVSEVYLHVEKASHRDRFELEPGMYVS